MTRKIDQLNFDPAGENPEDAYIAGIDAKEAGKTGGEKPKDPEVSTWFPSENYEGDQNQQPFEQRKARNHNRIEKVDVSRTKIFKYRGKPKNSKKK